jgi:hypothetical protein
MPTVCHRPDGTATVVKIPCSPRRMVSQVNKSLERATKTCGPQKLHSTVFRPHVNAVTSPSRGLIKVLSFLLLNVGDFKGVQAG